jgi:hypothetical protein
MEVVNYTAARENIKEGTILDRPPTVTFLDLTAKTIK